MSRCRPPEYTDTMKTAGVVLLHGYGVRGYIWGPVQAALGNRLGPIASPDFSAADPADLITRAKARLRRHSLECDGPVAAVGHSLGAAVAAVAARDLGSDIVSAVVLIAPPFGDRDFVPGPLLRFLLRRRLLPPILVRHRFFSPLTPRSVRRAVFKSAQPESAELQKIQFERRWFHTDMLSERLPQPSMVIASPADRLVPVSQSEEFAQTIGAAVHIFDESLGVAHNDLFASQEIAGTVADLIVSFVHSA